MITRRRVLTILAGAAALPAFSTHAAIRPAQWKGIALGADARIIIDHPDAPALIARATAEIRRLENIFSLYRRESQLSRLNRDGMLTDPPFEMIELLSLCAAVNARTSGAFDPTIQPLWTVWAEAAVRGVKPGKEQLRRARARTGWRHVRFSAERVSFERSGMALTLNGIAQGYIADRVAALFRQEGIENVLIDAGEITALGHAPDGRDWRITLGRAGGRKITLNNMAVATSAPLGTTFDDGGTLGHIIDPRTGKPGGRWARISVVERSAAMADGLSTAFCLMDRAEIGAARGSARVYLQPA